MIDNLTNRIFVLLISVIFVVSTSCTDYHLINPESDSLMRDVIVGDKVRIATKDDGVLKLKVLEIGEESLLGDNLETRVVDAQTLQFSEILKLEKGEFNTGKTVGLALGIVVGIPMLVTLYQLGWFVRHAGD